MNRRKFIAGLGAAALPVAARAQEAGRIYRLGVLIPASQASIATFFDELRLNGFVEGQNLEVTGNYSVRAEQIADSVATVIKAAPDAILCGPETYVRALQAATRTIPLDSMSEDLVGEGFAVSLAKPGGNITGVSLLSPELDGKRLEILIEAVPGVRRIAALAHAPIATKLHLEEQQTLARSRGVELSVVPFANAGDIGRALDEAKAEWSPGDQFSGDAAPDRQPRPHPGSDVANSPAGDLSMAGNARLRRPVWAMARCSCKCIVSGRDRSSNCCAAPNLPTCRWSNPRTSSWPSISRPRKQSALSFRQGWCCARIK